jgi:hypothetical protein
MIIILDAHSNQADVLYKRFTAVALGIGSVRGHSLTWRDCRAADSRMLSNPPYSVDRGGDCDIRPAAFGLKPAQNGTFKVADLSRFRRLFPDAELGDGVEVQVLSQALILQARDRGITLSLNGPLDAHYQFLNTLSVAVGLKVKGEEVAAADAVTDGRVLLDENGSKGLNILDSVTSRSEAARMLLTLAPTDHNKNAAHLLFVDLAEYRSRFEKGPSVPEGLGSYGGIVIGPGGHLSHATVKVGPNAFGFALIRPADPRAATVEQAQVCGGYQILDNIVWRDVTFVGTRIIFKGGNVSMQNMHFVNCTFEILPGLPGNQVLEFASINPQEASIEIKGSKAGM